MVEDLELLDELGTLGSSELVQEAKNVALSQRLVVPEKLRLTHVYLLWNAKIMSGPTDPSLMIMAPERLFQVSKRSARPHSALDEALRHNRRNRE